MSFFSRHDNPVYHRIEGRTIPALYSQKMPRSSIILLLTIVARNVHHPAQFGWYGLQSDTGRHRIPGGHHSFLRLGCFLADGAPRIVGGQLPETFPVNGVTTRHFVGRTPRAKEEFLTDGTVGFVFSTFAIVVGVESSVDAHATIVAMFEILGPSHPAKAAICTVVRAFVVGHPEVANITVVLSELDATLGTFVSVKTEN